jgi:hypothetical protein
MTPSDLRKTPFTVREVLGAGWDTFRRHAGLLIGVHAVAWGVQVVPGLIGAKYSEESSLQLVLVLAGTVLGLVTSVGLVRISLHLVDGRTPTYGDLFADAALLFRYVVGNVAFALAVGAVPLVLAIAGFRSEERWLAWAAGALAAALLSTVGVRLSLWPYFLVDEGLGAGASLRASLRATARAAWPLFLFYSAALGLFAVSVLPALLGFFVSVPVTSIAGARIYRALAARGEAGDC